jgi:hypothetical protein
MLIDIVNAGWVPIYNLNLSEDVPGYIQAPATALNYPWRHFICGISAGWPHATMSRCTSSTSPTSKPARRRRLLRLIRCAWTTGPAVRFTPDYPPERNALGSAITGPGAGQRRSA